VENLYALLEQQVVPEFYDRDAQGLPSKWLGRVRESMATLTPEFSASRAIREYTNDHYLPAAAGYNARAANDGKVGVDLLQWQRSIGEQWCTLRFGNVTAETKDGQHRFHITVVPGGLHPDQFRVELYAGPTQESGATPEILHACKFSAEPSGTIVYSVCCPAKRPAADYTARLVPSHARASVPLEAGQILWQQ
jgi:starch phosphorylase